MNNNLKIELEFLQKINYSLINSGKRIIESVVIDNQSEEEFRDLVCSISFVPSFIKPLNFGITYIGKNQKIKEDKIITPINFEYFYSLNESYKASIVVSLKKGEEVICEKTFETEVLTFDEWDGNSCGVQHLASFVLPNDKVVKDTIRIGDEYLGKLTNNSLQFCGYQSGKKEDVLNQISSLFYALKSLNISYCVPKASFEKDGQKIRLPLEILNTKLSTCLDTSLFFAACLEEIGLNPLLVLIDGHAYLGVWLNNFVYPNVVIEDRAYIVNQVAAQNLILLETTLITNPNETTFKEIYNEGKKNLYKRTNTFNAIDVKSARNANIKPLPLKISEEGRYVIDNAPLEVVKENYELDDSGFLENEHVKDRFDVWEKKLLDLNGRNKLVSFTPNSQHYQIFTTDIFSLFDEIIHNDVSLHPFLNIASLNISEKIYICGGEDQKEMFTSDLASDRIRLIVGEKKLVTIVKKLIRDAQSSIEESGSNTLFLTIGTLVYKDKGKIKHAPIILLPINITRGKEGRSYILSIREEEIVINQTLFEYLKINFDIDCSSLLKLPYDSDSDTYDLKKYFNTLRSKITGVDGFILSETSFIGIFSFTRFIMWNDLRNHKKELIKNDIVHALVDPSFVFKNKVEPTKISDLDSLLLPNRFAIPLSADSSQTEAILDASRGLSFVLNGPPGTGKSQTITNMIINSLYNGKKVLFVAQKMAALEVVKRRLDETGLGMFCIELHSNKAQKSDVLQQINNILETGKLKKPFEYEKCANDLLAKRNELNGIIKKLHKPFKNGFDLYENIIGYEEFKDEYKNIDVKGIDYSKINKNSYYSTISSLEKYLNYKNEIGEEYISLFSFINLDEYSIELRNRFVNALKEYKANLIEFKTISEELYKSCETELTFNAKNFNEFINSLKYFNSNKDNIYFNLLNKSNGYILDLVSLLESMVSNKANYEYFKNNFNEEIFNYNFKHSQFRLKQAQNLGFFAKRKTYKAIINELKSYALNPKEINNKTIVELLRNLSRVSDVLNNLKASENDLKLAFEDDFNGFDSDLKVILGNVKLTEEFTNYLDGFVNMERDKTFKLIVEADKKYEEIANTYEEVLDIQENILNEYKTDLLTLFDKYDLTENINLIDRVINRNERLKDFIIYKNEEESISKLNLGNLIDLNRNGVIQNKDLINVYKKNVSYNLALMDVESDKELNMFSGRSQNEKIEEYRKLIDKYNELTIKEVAYRLSKGTSAFFSKDDETSKKAKEFVILKKAISSNGRGISLRNLFDSTPNILHDICPCFLMSPLSVAQYLDPTHKKFDIVIFDEASQITTSDAVGAIARGESAIIVGDEKQLPPTRFFEADTSDEDDFFIEDGESVLSDCLNISMPKKYLTWHYRSKDESLIAFSNVEYYDNKLLTFPSPKSINSSISFRYCKDGIYEDRKNKVEAKAIVEEILRRLKDEKLSKKSIGVVTFSISQQTLILDLLQDAFRKNPDLEDRAYNGKEEIFVKNLESVQGDERDVIIFSICYGPTKEGRISFNFGPLSNVGGEKRLNVAVSRAREEMVVFSSLLGNQIDTSRAQGKGARGLKEFLDYAYKGRNFIVIKNGEQKEYKEGIEKYIARDLEKRGYKVHTNIGTSEFRVDIGIIDPNDENRYALGVLCDSRSYINSKTSKDRNVVQTDVLNQLGWRLIRIWSLDYFDSPNLVVDKIVEAINNPNSNDELKTTPKRKITFEKEDNKEDFNHSIDYVSSNYPSRESDSDSFFEEKETRTKSVINFFIRNEGPISERLLVKKVLAQFSISKNTKTTKAVFNECLYNKPSNFTNNMRFYWDKEEDKDRVGYYRVGSKYREFVDIPKEEIIIAIKDIMKNKLSLTKDELIKYVVSAFGFNKVGDTMKEIILTSIDFASIKNLIKVEGENVFYQV